MHWFRGNDGPRDFATKEAARQKQQDQLKEEATIAGRVVELCFGLEDKVLSLLKEHKRPSFQTVIAGNERLSLHRLSHPNDPIKLSGRLENHLTATNECDITEFNINGESSDYIRHLFIARYLVGKKPIHRESSHFVIKPSDHNDHKVELFAPSSLAYEYQPYRLASNIGRTALSNLEKTNNSLVTLAVTA